MTIRLHRGDLPELSRYTTSVAIDTETMGLNPHRDRLCVVQMSNGDGSADVIRDLDSLPELPYQLLKMDRYNVFFTEDGRKSATMNTSRGCPFRCKFCSDPVLNEGRWRGFSAGAGAGESRLPIPGTRHSHDLFSG